MNPKINLVRKFLESYSEEVKVTIDEIKDSQKIYISGGVYKKEDFLKFLGNCDFKNIIFRCTGLDFWLGDSHYEVSISNFRFESCLFFG